MRRLTTEDFKESIGDPVWPKDCWPWLGAMGSGGYGQFSNVFAHRASYALFIGTIPINMLVLHDCDRRDCVNPHHLFLGTYQDNNNDMWAKGRANPPGKGEKRIGTVRITEVQALEILRLHNTGLRKIEIVNKMNDDRVTWRIVNNLVRGDTWKHLLRESQS